MAIEIITPGKLPQEKKLKYTCSNCGTVFKFQKRDAIDTSYYPGDHRDPWNVSYTSYIVHCPLCKHRLSVPDISYNQVD